ncbi:helix-turn-helix transcriptional regulator [Sphingomonas sp. GB1N7]|uniref:helix-turn-helix transcriptional regulator n=1 Tax=Parasphingomonas caseinilytica TaxID=3096158 RepID=UPI002FC657FD
MNNGSGFESVIDAVYEAGVLPERWPHALDLISRDVGARGGMLLSTRPDDFRYMCSEDIEPVAADFIAQGWPAENTRISRYVAREPHAGFLTDLDLHTQDEIDTLPMFRDFLSPRGFQSGAATMIDGLAEEELIVSIEAFRSPEAAQGAVDTLDRLRPHLARAVQLSTQMINERRRGAMDALEVIGTGAALLDGRGRVQNANHLFERDLGDQIGGGRNRLRLRDPNADRLLSDALDELGAHRRGRSLPFPNADRSGSMVMHLMPISGAARDVFSGSAAIVLIADPQRRALPDYALLQAMFDLTPTEARIARQLTDGCSPAGIATSSKLSLNTVRSHLKQIYLKTGSTRQSSLVSLFSNLSP